MNSAGRIQKVKSTASPTLPQDSHFLKKTFLNAKERGVENSVQKKTHPFLGQLLKNLLLSVIKGELSPITGKVV